MRGCLIVFVCALVATLVIGIGTPGSANVIKRSDGNDTRGPLDLGGGKVSHVSGGSLFQMTALAPFTNKEANGKNGFFQVGIDTNADRRPNYYIDVFFASGHFRGVLFKPSGAVITYNLKAARVSPKAVKVTLPHADIVQKGSYDFVIFSIYIGAPCTKRNPCIDTIPNRYPLIRHDFTPPSVTWGSVPGHSSSVSNTLTMPMPFSVKDDPYGSGLKRWTIQRSTLGTPGWVNVAIGTALSASPDISGDEGQTYDFRIVAVDRQGNGSTSSQKRIAFPFDDRNPLFQYDTPTLNDSVSGALLETTTSIPNGQGVVFSASLDGFACLLGGPTTGAISTADVKVNGIISTTFIENVTTGARQEVCVGVTSGDTVEVDTTSIEPFVFDGAVVTPPDI